jgi:ComF family protein
MAESVPYLTEETIIVPVPTATLRVRLRGYDHAWLLAKNLGKYLDRPSQRLLSRYGHTRQVGAGRAKRQEQLSGAFYPRNPKAIKGARVLLVDDILTTGATIEECARTLKKAGAKRVDAIVFAQKQ